MKLKHLIALTISCCALLLRCSDNAICGSGGSSETVNAKVFITDTLVRAEVPIDDLPGFSLHLFSKNYHPYEKTGITVTAERQADATITAAVPSPGDYNILLASSARNVACFLGSVSFVKGTGDTIDCVLAAPSTIHGELVAAAASELDNIYIVSIYGSPFYSMTDPVNGFALVAVPRGGYTLSVRPAEQRLFIGTSNYVLSSTENNRSTNIRIVIP